MVIKDLLFRVAAVIFVGGISLLIFWWGAKIAGR